MACIVSALKSNNATDLFGEPINNLTLALVTPLGTDHDDVSPLPF
jgi:hypothetical protein